jgi:ABC-2 type transport system permease protein
VTVTRDLFGNPGAAAGQTWIAENAMMMAIVWPLLIVAVTLPLAVHRYQSLSR